MEINEIASEYKRSIKNLRRIVSQYGYFDLLIGIPFLKESDTLTGILKTIEEGIRKYYPDKKVLIMGVGVKGFSEQGKEVFDNTEIHNTFLKKISTLISLKGKGWGMRVVLEVANMFNSDVIFLDADLRSMVDKNGKKVGFLPETIKWIYGTIADRNFDYVCPYYIRHKWDGTITNFICYPIVSALYGKRIRQPIGGEIGLSKRFVKVLLKQPDSWFTDIGTYGIDIWITVEAIVNRMTIAQMFLTSKIHDPSEGKLGNMFKQVAHALFERIIEHRGFIMGLDSSELRKSLKVKTFNVQFSIEPEEVPFHWKDRIDYFRKKLNKNKDLYERLLKKENFEYLEHLYLKHYEIEFDMDMWAKIVYDFIIKYALAHIEKIKFSKQKVLDLMGPVYLLRSASFRKHTENISTQMAEERIEKQVDEFIRHRKDFVKEFSLIFGLMGI